MEQFSPPSVEQANCPTVEQNNDVCHDRAPLIRQIAQLWNSRSTIGHQDLANHQSWNHVISLIAELRKTQHFCKYFLPGGAMHTKSI